MGNSAGKPSENDVAAGRAKAITGGGAGGGGKKGGLPKTPANAVKAAPEDHQFLEVRPLAAPAVQKPGPGASKDDSHAVT